jgi:hypothetical protein
MIEKDELPHHAIIRSRLAVAELECAECLARVARQRELILQGIGTASGQAEQRLSQLLQRQGELEKRRADLRARLRAALGVRDPAA